MKQYIPSWMELPDLGGVREMVDRNGELKALGVVYGHLPKERVVLIRALNVDDNGYICINEQRNK